MELVYTPVVFSDAEETEKSYSVFTDGSVRLCVRRERGREMEEEKEEGERDGRVREGRVREE